MQGKINGVLQTEADFSGQTASLTRAFYEDIHAPLAVYLEGIEFGQKKGDYTPAFFLDFLKANKAGRVAIEVDMEIDDIDSRKQRACFFIYSELGLVEIFANNIMKLVHGDIDKINLNQ